MANIANGLRERIGGRRVSALTREAYGVIWPDGSASLSWQFRHETDSLSAKQEWEWTSGGEGLPEVSPRVGELRPMLDSTPESTQAVERPKRKNGLKGITSFGKKMVRSGANLVEKRHGAGKCVFATFTVPSLSRQERRELAAQWAQLTGRLVQRIARELEKRVEAPEVISVSEVQPKRLTTTGEAYLHLHLIFPGVGEHPTDFLVNASEIRAWWIAELERRLGRKLQSNVQVRLEVVKRTVAGYLAKYLSKGCGTLRNAVADLGEDSIPGQWWNMNKFARSAVKRGIQKGFRTGELLLNLLEYLEGEGWKVPEASCGPVVIESGGDCRVVAWWFQVWGDLYRDLTGMLKLPQY